MINLLWRKNGAKNGANMSKCGIIYYMNYSPKYTISDKIRNDLREIEKLRGDIRGSRILPEIEASIRLRASVESVHSSTSIEGNPLSANEVRAVITSDSPLTREEYAKIEVQNYKKALDFIDKRRRGSQDIILEDVLDLHGIITDGLVSKSRNGKIRSNPVYIEDQNHDILYEGADADIVKREIVNLIEWIKSNQFTLNPVIIASIIHFHFVAIHPFSDGNGRTARALTSLYLALNQYDSDGSLVLDSYYAQDRKAYYDVLQLVNGKNYTHSNKADITPWIEYFVEGFLSSLHVLDAEIRMLNLSFLDTTQRELSREDQDILSYISKFGAISISDAEAILPELSRRSIQRRLKELVDKGILEILGETHGTRYQLKTSRM